jgi:hypothetical protein
MNEKPNGLTRLARDVFDTRDDEIQCDQAAIQATRAADALFSDAESQRQYPGLWRHMQFCPDCAAEYRMALTLARLEADGRLEPVSPVPPLPDPARRPPFWSQVQETLTARFPGFPVLTGAAARGVDLCIGAPVEVTLRPGLRVSFDAAASTRDPGLCDLFCAVVADDAPLRATLEGAPVWLQLESGAVVQETALNDVGDAAFYQLAPQQYTWRLCLADQEFVVMDILLPGHAS